MSEFNDRINKLQNRLERMVEYQEYFYREINQIRAEINSLKQSSPEIKVEKPRIREQVAENVFAKPPLSSAPQPANYQKQKTYQKPIFTQTVKEPTVESKSNLEEFVGRNLISLVGIVITIIGVGIGAKYAIDRNLISPAMRIFLGYLFAIGLFGVAVRLKVKYLNFSAVLLSGSLAIMYFLTYFAYSFYQLIPQQKIAFSMMLLLTASTVLAAIKYNRQVIAHIGLVGAYAVPFLLSENSGRADVLFSYMAIINFGILAISVKKFWKALYYSAFIITWLIYASWYLSGYRAAEHFAAALGFSAIFFLTFYLTFLSYKLTAREEFSAEIVVLVLLNSFIFYGFGYSILDSRADFSQFTGLFTLVNSLIHFVIAAVIYKYKLGDRKNLYFAAALCVTFLTIAVPVQFKGDWITIIWSAEAAYLFWVGRTKRIALYENLSYLLMALAGASLLNNWQNAFNSDIVLTPLFNSDFLTSILFVAAVAFIYVVNKDERYKTSAGDFALVINFILPAVFLIALYNTFRIEIGNYWHIQLVKNGNQLLPEKFDDNLRKYNAIWQINYSMFFLTILSLVNVKKTKSDVLGFINLGLNSLTLLVFLSVGLYVLGELRLSYLTQVDAEVFPRGVFCIVIRYISFAFVAALIAANYEYVKQNFLKEKVPDLNLYLAFDFVFYVALLWIASSELVNWMDIFGHKDSYKLGLSILWGIYSLLLIVLGIVKKKQHLRVGAIAIFALTLAKLFFYDMADLDTISKTVVFVSLGMLLLIISFLYNKYKDLIFETSKG